MYKIYVTSVWVCVLQIAMYDELSASNATGSFQNQCSVASKMDPSPDEPSSSGTRAKRPIRKRYMTALLAEVAFPSPMKSRCQRGSKSKALAELVHHPKRIRISADANDNTINNVDVNHSTAIAGTAVVSQVKAFIRIITTIMKKF